MSRCRSEPRLTEKHSGPFSKSLSDWLLTRPVNSLENERHDFTYRTIAAIDEVASVFISSKFIGLAN